MKRTYKKGILYSPDDMADLSSECIKYFNTDDYQKWNNPDFEYGSGLCIQSFQITIIIKELNEKNNIQTNKKS